MSANFCRQSRALKAIVHQQIIAAYKPINTNDRFLNLAFDVHNSSCRMRSWMWAYFARPSFLRSESVCARSAPQQRADLLPAFQNNPPGRLVKMLIKASLM